MPKKPYSLRDGIPPRRRDVLFVQSPDAGERLKFLVYSQSVWGVYTHYNGKTKPCYENHDLCEGGHSLLNLRWKGYLHGWSYARNDQVIIQLTLEAANQLVEQLAESAVLRGLTIEVCRTAKKKGRSSCHVLGQYAQHDSAKLPPEIDPLRSLYNMWGLPYRPDALYRHLSGDPPPAEGIVKIA